MKKISALRLALLMLVALLLPACGTTYATMTNSAGEEVMLLGHDPVAYFTMRKSMRGDPAIKASLADPERTYYFVSDEHKRLFLADPAKYEPQYGGFCSGGSAYGLKTGSDPTEWEIFEGRLFIFGDVLGHMEWLIDPAWNVKHGDMIWPEARDSGRRSQTLWRYAVRVPWYKNRDDVRRDFAEKYPGRSLPNYATGNMFTNLFTKQPGWRAREGFGPQPVVGFVGEDPCPPACPRTESQAFVRP